MEKTYDKALQVRLEEYIAGLGEGGQRKASAVIGYSEATISQYRNSKYRGDVSRLESRLRELFGNQDEAANLPTDGGYAPTSTSQNVYETIRICHLMGGTAVECGDAGVGKTMAAKKYAEDYPTSTVMVTVNPCFATITPFLKLLCHTLKLPVGPKDEMWLAIHSHLQGGRKVLIIDEAQHLTIKTIDTIRDFCDKNRELGVVFIGNADTVSPGRSSSRRESYAQIQNRRRFTEIRRTTQTTRDDIKLLFPALAGHEKEIDLLHVVAQSEWAVRGATTLYVNAAKNNDTSYTGLAAMAKAMRIVTY